MLTTVWRGAGRRARVTVALAALMVLAGCTSPSPPPSPGAVAADPQSWPAIVRRSLDDTALDGTALELPDRANVFAARIFAGDSPAYAFVEAGGGAFTENFFPASAIKVLAALGALDYLAGFGLTGDAVVDDGYTVRDYYDAALRWSSNEDYSALVRLAGVAWLNNRFLPDNGFADTAIQEPYGADEQVRWSPAMALSEQGREVDLPAREGDDDYGCDGGNCSNLFDLADAVRRVVLDRELPAGERFALAPADIAGLQDALLGAEGFIAPGVADVLGPDAKIYSKPGWVPGLDCVEAAVIDAGGAGRYLVAVSAPDDDGCDMLPRMARGVLDVLTRCERAVAVRADASLVDVAGGRQVGPAAAGSRAGCRL